MKAIDLKTKLFSLVQTYLGAYLPGNSPAVTVGLIPTGFTPRGLELFIRAYPVNRAYRGKLLIERWEFQLNQYGDSNEIYDAAKVIQDSLIPPPTAYYVEAPTGSVKVQDLQIVRTVYFKWTNEEVIHKRY